ncbi:MAG: hypothetical protein GVY29_07610 [Spirochaetes bacterium]|jgi:hypothetical protein|nr:hypothetical protein [Spirochaetota bacterium]
MYMKLNRRTVETLTLEFGDAFVREAVRQAVYREIQNRKPSLGDDVEDYSKVMIEFDIRRDCLFGGEASVRIDSYDYELMGEN